MLVTVVIGGLLAGIDALEGTGFGRGLAIGAAIGGVGAIVALAVLLRRRSR